MVIKMKKLTVLACVLVLLTGVMGCGQQAEENNQETVNQQETAEQTEAEVTQDETNEEAQQVEEDARTTFTVGFDAEFPPYGYRDDNGEYVGFDLSLAEEVCARKGWELVKQPIAWETKDMDLTSGSIDCIWNGFTMNGREDLYTWSQPYVDNSQVFVVAADSGITALADLAGKAVGVQKESSALAALNDEENADNIALRDSFGSLTEYGDYNMGFMDLEAGVIDALAIDIGVAQYQVDARSGDFIIMDELLATEQYGIGFLLGNEALRDEVEATLMEMLEDGSFAEIAETWGLSDYVCFGE